ncbi:MAG: DUF5343 domain-containing protein [Limisphaerales bacterium]
MPLPDSYTVKPNSIQAYFDAILNAQPPERFSIKFLENLGFTSTNDRLFVGVLKDLGFLTNDGVPQQRYFEFLDRSQSKSVLAAGIKDSFSDLFAVNKNANELSVDDVRNKLRTLYAGKKTDSVIDRIASTFRSLCDIADWVNAQAPTTQQTSQLSPDEKKADDASSQKTTHLEEPPPQAAGKLRVGSLQYHINIVLPETRDQGVYDAIFKSLREHLG